MDRLAGRTAVGVGPRTNRRSIRAIAEGAGLQSGREMPDVADGDDPHQALGVEREHRDAGVADRHPEPGLRIDREGVGHQPADDVAVRDHELVAVAARRWHRREESRRQALELRAAGGQLLRLLVRHDVGAPGGRRALGEIGIDDDLTAAELRGRELADDHLRGLARPGERTGEDPVERERQAAQPIAGEPRLRHAERQQPPPDRLVARIVDVVSAVANQIERAHAGGRRDGGGRGLGAQIRAETPAASHRANSWPEGTPPRPSVHAVLSADLPRCIVELLDPGG